MVRFISLCAAGLLVACGPSVTQVVSGPVTSFERSTSHAFYQLEDGEVLTKPWSGGPSTQILPTGTRYAYLWAQDAVAMVTHAVAAQPEWETHNFLWTPTARREVPLTMQPLHAGPAGEWFLLASIVDDAPPVEVFETGESLEPGPMIISSSCWPETRRMGARVVMAWCEGEIAHLAAWTPGDFAQRIEFPNPTARLVALETSSQFWYLDSLGALVQASSVTGATVRLAEGVDGFSVSLDSSRIAWRTPSTLVTSDIEPFAPVVLVSGEPVLGLVGNDTLDVVAYASANDASEKREWKVVSRDSPGHSRILTSTGQPYTRPTFSEDGTVVAYKVATEVWNSSVLFAEDVVSGDRTELGTGVGWYEGGAGSSIHYVDNPGSSDFEDFDVLYVTDLYTSRGHGAGELVSRSLNPFQVGKNPGSQRISYLVERVEEDGTDRRGLYVTGP